MRLRITGLPVDHPSQVRNNLCPPLPPWDAERGTRQLKAVFDRIGLTREMFEAAPFTRLKELKHLRDTGQIDPELRWNAMEPV